MFRSVMSSLGKYLFQDEKQDQQSAGRHTKMMKLPAGQFYGHRSSLTTGRGAPIKECIFNEATLSIVKIAPFTYELQVERLFEEGEKELLLEEQQQESSNESQNDSEPFLLTNISFPINKDMKFARESSATHGGIMFQWQALPDESSQEKKSHFDKWLRPFKKSLKFEYDPEKAVTAPTLQLFHQLMAQCIFETVTKRPFTEADDSLLEDIMSGKQISSLLTGPDHENDRSVQNLHDRPKLTDQSASVLQETDPLKVYEIGPLPFYIYATQEGLFQLKAARCLVRFLRGDEAFAFTLWIYDLDASQIVYHQPVSPQATQHVDRTTRSFLWTCLEEEGSQYWTFSLRFPTENGLFDFANRYAKTIYEILNKESLKSIAQDDENYLFKPFVQDVRMALETDNDTDSDNSDTETESDEIPKLRGKLHHTSSDDDEPDQSNDSQEKNTLLALGYKNDRTFVSRGQSIGVFKSTNDNKLAFQTTIKGVGFTPTKMMLHEADTSLLLMNPLERDRIYKMDLEVGRVVEEWRVSEHGDAVTNMIPDTKYAPLTSAKTLIGLNSQSFFRIDPRLPGAKRVDTETKQYVSKNQFTCGVTTGKGELAVASAKGDIRLYDSLDKRAKTLLPGFGDPILGIDVTESGKFVLATCPSYLLFLDTRFDTADSVTSSDINRSTDKTPRGKKSNATNSETSSNYKTGFSKPMGKQKPIPKRLQLSPEHVAYMGGHGVLSFTEAHFSTGQLGEEKAILASMGPYVITWKVKDILQGNLFNYAIKKYSDTVVADQFKFNQDRHMIVTLPNQVTMASKNHFSTPKKTSSFSDIVDSPF